MEASTDKSGRFLLKIRRYMEKFRGAVLNLAISDPLRPFTPERSVQISQFLADFSPVLTSIPSHLTYSAMIHRAITDLNKKSGCSEEDISRFIGSTYSNLPWAHSPLLKIHLRNLCQDGEIVLSSSGCYSIVEVDSVPEPRRGRKAKRKRIQKQVNCLSLGEKPGKRRRPSRKLQKLNGSVGSEGTEKHIHEKEDGTEEKINVGSQTGLTFDQGRMVDDYELEEDKFQVGAGKNQRDMVFYMGFPNDNVYVEHDHQGEHEIYDVSDDNKKFRHKKCMQHKENVVEDDMEHNQRKICNGVATEVDRGGIGGVEESISVYQARPGMVGKHEELHTEEVARKLVELGELNGKTQSSIDHLIQFPEIQNPDKINKDILFLESAACLEAKKAGTKTKETNGKTTPSDMITEYQSDKHQIVVCSKGDKLNATIMPNEIGIDGRSLRHQIIDIERGNAFEDELVPKVDALVRNHQTSPQENQYASKKMDMGILSAKPFSQVMDIHGNKPYSQDVVEYENELQIGTFKGILGNNNVHWNHDPALVAKNTHTVDKRMSSINSDNMEDDEIEYLGNKCRDIVLDHCLQPRPVMQNMGNNSKLIKSGASPFTGQAGSQQFKLKRVLRSGVCCFIKSQNTENKVSPVPMPVEEELPNGQARVVGLLQNEPHVQRRRGRPRKHAEKPPRLDLAKTQTPPGLNLPHKRRGRPLKANLT